MDGSKVVCWGIVGTGKICSDFVAALKLGCSNAIVVAVGSRSQEAATTFGKTFDIPKCYPSLTALLDDPEVDAVYVGTPHPFHREAVSAALQKGKHVLCEKPFTINAQDLSSLIWLAQEHKVFLMEAMWTRFFPCTKEWHHLVSNGKIGTVRSLHCSFGFQADDQEIGRLVDPHLGGGALLDVGVYLVSLAFLVFKAFPTKIESSARTKNGVDIQTSFILSYPEGQALLTCGFGSGFYSNTAEILGTEGSITIPTFWCPTSFTLKTREGVSEKTFALQENSHAWNFTNSIGLAYEADAVTKYILAGAKESVEMPLTESLQVLQVMDIIRSQIGLVYPSEKK